MSESTSAKLDKLLRVGNKVRIVYAPDLVKKTRVVHIRALVDLAVYVVCWWNSKSWHYRCMTYDEFETIAHRLEHAGLSPDHEELLGE